MLSPPTTWVLFIPDHQRYEDCLQVLHGTWGIENYATYTIVMQSLITLYGRG